MSDLTPALLKVQDVTAAAPWLRSMPEAEFKSISDRVASEGGGFMREYRKMVGLVCWAARKRYADGKYGVWAGDYAEKVGVSMRTLLEWRQRIDNELAAAPTHSRRSESDNAVSAQADIEPGGAVEQSPPSAPAPPAPPQIENGLVAGLNLAAPSAAQAATEVDEAEGQRPPVLGTQDLPNGSAPNGTQAAPASSTPSAGSPSEQSGADPLPAAAPPSEVPAASPDASAHVDRGEPGPASDRGHETKRRVGTSPPSANGKPPALQAGDGGSTPPGGTLGYSLANAILALRFAAPEKIAISADLPELEQLAERIREAIRLHAKSVNGDLTRRDVTPMQKRSVEAQRKAGASK